MAFKKRLSAPDKSNRYFYKDNPFYQSGYGLPNCTTHAYGRFFEVLGEKPKLSTRNAEDWWAHNDGYKRGQTPKLGAVICWRKGKAGNGADGAGHVGFVEEIHDDGSITISESGWKASRTMWTQRLYPPFNFGSAYTLQGFIYNPAVKDEDMTTKIKVGIYVGHGKSTDGSWDPGCTYNGKTEAGLMLPIVKAFVKHARFNNFEVFTDAFSGNNMNAIKQVQLSEKNHVAVHIPVHCDWFKAPTGTLPLFCLGSKSGKRLAACLNRYVEKMTGETTRGVTARSDLYELNKTSMPACIFECGSIKHDADEWDAAKEINDYGKALAKGLCDYFGKTFKDMDNVKTFKVEVTAKELNIRAGAGTKYAKKGSYKKGTTLTIAETKTAGNLKWGKLVNGKGWICLKYTKKK